MNEEIKTEDIIKSLRVCYVETDCVGCMFDISSDCDDQLMRLAADRLEQLSQKHIKIQHNNEDYVPVVKPVGNPMPPDKSEALKARIVEKHYVSDSSELQEQKIMQRAINTYSTQAQCDVAIEEMAELTKALMKIRRVADDYEKVPAALANVIEEIADVEIMIDQLKIMYGEKAVEAVRGEKLERLERRLNEQSTATGKTAKT